MFLSSNQINKAVESGDIVISPFQKENLKPASYSFTLDAILKKSPSSDEIVIPEEGYTLTPGEFVLGKTREKVNLNNKFLCILGTRSSLAKRGIDALQSSTIAEPDTNGQFSLEISNRGNEDVVLLPGMRIVKAVFSPVHD